MRGSPPTLLSTAITSALFIVAFLVAAYFMVRRARNPKIVPRDAIERRTLPLLKDPSRREKVFFAAGVLVAGAAPWLTYLLER
jgi:Zn-dependent M28 family amino/carboxypeptidase